MNSIYWRAIIAVLFLLGNLVLASDARFAGMGNLSLIFPDDFHRLDIYDFGGIPAGFYRIDTLSSVMIRGSGLSEIWQRDSLSYLAIGSAIPQRLIDYAPLEAISSFAVIPQFTTIPVQLVYSSCSHEEKYSSFGELRKPETWRIYADYGQLSRKYLGDTIQDKVRTPGFSFVYAKPISEFFDYGFAGDIFYGGFNAADGEESATLLPFGAGGGIAYYKKNMSLGINAEYHYPIFKFERASGSTVHTESFQGHAASPSFGSSIKIADFHWVSALNYKWVNLGGKENSVDIGNLSINGYTIRSGVLFNKAFLRFALFGRYDSKKPVYSYSSGDTWFETIYKTYDMGGGIGIMIDKITAGIEGLYNYFLADDRETQVTATSDNLTGKIGLEAEVINSIFLRTGFNYIMIDPDLNQSTDLIKTNKITGGIGVNIIRNARIDLAYNYQFSTLESDPGEKIIDHIACLYFKYVLSKAK